VGLCLQLGGGTVSGLLLAFELTPPPPNVGVDEKDNKSSGVHSGWVTANFMTCLDGANDGVVQRYTHTWLWHMVVRFLFSDRSGNTISSMVLSILCVEWDMMATCS
jgi:hypothetical protein